MEINLSFEQAMKKLEEIVKMLESGNITLEESLNAYQQGVILSRYCSEKLEEAEGKIMKIVNKEGKLYEEFLPQNLVEDR